MELRIQQLAPNLRIPEQAHEGDAGIDLRSAVDFSLAPGERRRVPTGIAVEIPPGHAGLVLPRSGLADRHGIALVNSPGLIDAGYRGEIHVILINLDANEVVEFSCGDRIAQLVLVRFESVEIKIADALTESTRGDRGFGSSGKG
ncbi:MAG: dUTP diphosphatase [Acidobacteria bacterium]|nr:MAG: dUTP diphosphatase [Acidobacteriota bacterium]